jgi:ABC-type proline/glycine betaine transport system permease subunit
MLASLAIVAMALLADGLLRGAQELLMPSRNSAEGTCER